MKILFISTALPPNFESQTIRNLFFIKGLQNAGHEVIGVTNKAGQSDGTLIDILPRPMEIIFVDNGWYANFSSWILQIKMKLLERVLNVLGPLFVVPDLNSGWGREIIKDEQVSTIANGCELIITASGSYESHLAGLNLSKKYDLPLVCELGDPWASNPIWPETFWWKKFTNKWLESKVIKHCIAAVFTTPETKNVYQKKYGENKFHYVPMGFSRNEFNLTVRGTYNLSAINLVYVGVAYKGSRDITPLLDRIAAAKAINLYAHFYGRISESFENYVFRKKYDFVEFYGQVSYQESIKIISEANVLVILGNDSKLQIPGKTYMYLASGKPIIYLANQDLLSDPTWNLIRAFDGVYGFDKTLSGLEETLVNISENYDVLLKKSAVRLKDPHLTQFDWQVAASQFNRIVETVHASSVEQN